MQLKKNIKPGKIKINSFLLIFFLTLIFLKNLKSEENFDGNNTNLKILDKISSEK